MRTAAFAMVFAATCLQISGKGYGIGAWAYLVALLLVYPHVQYWIAKKSIEPIKTELRGLTADSLLLGAFCAVVAFSDWLTFSVALATLSNNGANKGWRSTGPTALALAVGALIGSLVGGFHFAPHTELPAVLLCIVGIGGYVLVVANIAFYQNVKLRQTRANLKVREQELLEANQTLHKNLVEIDGLRRGLAEQANRDTLTHLFNRRYLDSSLEREIARCLREGKPLCLVMIDIDHFKKFNDRYGHQAGDACLKAIARALQECAKRAGDLAARYGGEEFSLVLPDADGADAMRLMEELLAVVQGLAIPHQHSMTGVVTISAGLAVMQAHSTATAEHLIRAADDALYYAKWGGRNRVHRAPDIFSQSTGHVGLPSDLEPLEWQPSYASGNVRMDEEHEQLFLQVNGIFAALLAGRSASEVAPLIDNLIRHVSQHFEVEEQLLTAAGYPGLTEHVGIHRKLMGRAVEVVSQYRNAKMRIGELLEFLAQELIVNHVRNADRRFPPLLADLSGNAAPDAPHG